MGIKGGTSHGDPRISRSRRSPPPPRIMCQPVQLIRMTMATAHGAPSSLSAGRVQHLTVLGVRSPSKKGRHPHFPGRKPRQQPQRPAQGCRTGPALRLLAARGLCHLHEGQRRLPCTGPASRHPGTTRRAGQLRGQQESCFLADAAPLVPRGPEPSPRPRGRPACHRRPPGWALSVASVRVSPQLTSTTDGCPRL